MSQIEVTAAPSRPAARARSAGNTFAHRFALRALLILIVLAPLPLGSARPFFWGVSAAYLGAVMVLYALFQHLGQVTLRINLRLLVLPGVLSGMLWLFLALQVIPLGSFPIPNAAGDPLTSATISVAPNMTLMMLLRQIGYAAFFFLMLQVAVNANRRKVMLHVILWSIVLYGIYGIIILNSGDTILGVPKWAYLGSATGPFVNRNSFATYLAFGCVIALAMFVFDLVRLVRTDGPARSLVANMILHGVVYAVLVLVVVATNSRMGLGVTVAGTAAVLLAGGLKISRHGPMLWVLAAVGAVMLAALAYFGPGMIDRLGDVSTDTASRGELYRQVWEMIMSRPLLGFGGGTFELAFPLFHRPPVLVDFIWNSAHNSYLALWVDLGLVAGSLPLLALCYFAVLIVRAHLRTRKTSLPGNDWLAQCVAIGAIVVGAVHSLVDFSLEIQANTWIFLALLACGVATTVRAQQNEVDQ